MLGIFLFFIYLVIVCLTIYYARSPKRLKWWVKIVTQYPYCTYYFGPFDSAQEARLNHTAYLQDIQEEGAQGISVQIEQGQPQQLTIYD